MTPVGSVTVIKCQADFHQYLEKITKGLNTGKGWTKQLFKCWDSIPFPDQNSKYRGCSLSENEKRREEEVDEVMNEVEFDAEDSDVADSNGGSSTSPRSLEGDHD